MDIYVIFGYQYFWRYSVISSYCFGQDSFEYDQSKLVGKEDEPELYRVVENLQSQPDSYAQVVYCGRGPTHAFALDVIRVTESSLSPED